MIPIGKKISSASAWLIGSALFLGASGQALAHSTLSGITVTRSFTPASVAPGQTVTVTLSVKVGAIGASPLRGFYLSESVPDILTLGSSTVKLNGSVIPSTKESMSPGALYSNCKMVRWLLEMPPAWTENRPVPASSTLVVTYQATIPSATPAGKLIFPGLSWVGMIPTLGESGDHFGFEDLASTLPVVSLPALALSPTSLSFSAEEGASNPASRSVLGSNPGAGTLPALVPAIAYLSQGGWLTVTASGSGNGQSLQNSVSLAGLAPNTYGATVKVSAAGASNSPQSYTVSFVVSAKPSLTRPTMELSPTSLHFVVEEGKEAPSQTVTVGNRGAGTLAPASPSPRVVTGSGWLTVNTTGSGNSQLLDNKVLASKLAPGSYQATVSVSSSGASNTPQSYLVFLDVTPRPVVASDSGPGGDASGPDGGPEASPHHAGAEATSPTVLTGGCTMAGGGGPRFPWVLLLALGASRSLRHSRSRRRCR